MASDPHAADAEADAAGPGPGRHRYGHVPRLPDADVPHALPADELPGRALRHAARLRSEVNSELNFPPNFEGLVLGCIDADFCK